MLDINHVRKVDHDFRINGSKHLVKTFLVPLSLRGIRKSQLPIQMFKQGTDPPGYFRRR